MYDLTFDIKNKSKLCYHQIFNYYVLQDGRRTFYHETEKMRKTCTHLISLACAEIFSLSYANEPSWQWI